MCSRRHMQKCLAYSSNPPPPTPCWVSINRGMNKTRTAAHSHDGILHSYENEWTTTISSKKYPTNMMWSHKGKFQVKCIAWVHLYIHLKTNKVISCLGNIYMSWKEARKDEHKIQARAPPWVKVGTHHKRGVWGSCMFIWLFSHHIYIICTW